MKTIRRLGRQGRFGNQLFQYAHLRQEAGTDYQCPPWVGQYLFGLNDPSPSKGAEELGFAFPLQSSYYDQTLFRSLFQPITKVHDQVSPVIEMLHTKGHTLIGIHLRRGDYGTFKRRSARWCFVAPTTWYLTWLEEHRALLDNAVLIIASDEPDKVLSDFRGFNVVVMNDAIDEAPYYSDFYALTQCDTLLISNSVFSFAASMLNSRADCWRPRLSQQQLIPYDPWDSPVVLKDERY